MKRYIVIFLFFPLTLFSQAKGTDDFYFSSVEEEVHILNKRARDTGAENPSLMLQLAQDAYTLSKNEELYESQVDALVIMGTAYFHLLEIDKSIDVINSSNELARSINYIDGLWFSTFTLGTVYTYLEDVVKAESYYREADALIVNKNDIKHIAVLKEIVKLYIQQNLYEQAVSVSEEALLMAETLEEERSIVELTLLSGEIEFKAGKIREANSFFRDIITMTSALGDFQEERGTALSFLGKCYALLGDYHLALANGQDALLISVKNNSDRGRLGAYDSLSFIYQLMDDFEKAYINLQLYYKQKEILENKKSLDNLNKIKAYYGSFEKEQEIGKQQLKIENQNQLILIGSLMIALFIIILLVLYFLYRKNSKIAEKLSRDLNRELVLSKTDPVTGLPNRKEMEELIRRAVNGWKKNFVDFSLLFISFEYLKNIDDEWGKGTGEKLQKYISSILKTELKGQDIVSVWKPFLFLILLPETDLASMKSVKHKIDLKFSKGQYIQNKRELILNMELGSYTYSGDGNRSDCISRCREELNKKR